MFLSQIFYFLPHLYIQPNYFLKYYLILLFFLGSMNILLILSFLQILLFHKMTPNNFYKKYFHKLYNDAFYLIKKKILNHNYNSFEHAHLESKISCLCLSFPPAFLFEVYFLKKLKLVKLINFWFPFFYNVSYFLSLLSLDWDPLLHLLLFALLLFYFDYLLYFYCFHHSFILN